MSIVAQFEIRYSRFLDEHGRAVQPLPAFARDATNLVALYRWMVLMRAYDTKAIALQRTGQLGTFASLLGKEALEAGVGSAMAKDDVFLMTYRENGDTADARRHAEGAVSLLGRRRARHATIPVRAAISRSASPSPRTSRTRSVSPMP